MFPRHFTLTTIRRTGGMVALLGVTVPPFGIRIAVTLATAMALEANAALYPDGTTSEQTLSFGAQFAGRALSFRIYVPGVGSGQRNTSATFLNSRYAITSAHNIVDLLIYNPTSYEVADGTNFRNARGNVMPVKRVLVHPGYDSSQNTPDIAILEFSQPFYASNNQTIGAIQPGEKSVSAGFGRWGTPSTAPTGLPPQDGGLRGWEARVSDIVFSSSADFYQSSLFGSDTAGLTLNGRGASGDSGGPVYNIAGEIVGLTDSGSANTSPSGQTTFLKLAAPGLRAWIEANTPLPTPVLAMSPSAGGTAMRLTWDADAIGYQLQTSETLSGWTNQGSVLTGPGTMEDPIGNLTRRFYRLSKP